MSLQDHKIKTEYRSLIDNVIQDFYIPLLSEATSYKRAVGFFSSSALAEISKGISAIAKRGGKIQIVASPYLSEEDIDAIKAGYSSRSEIIENALLRQLSDEETDYYTMGRLNLLANLIADDILDIRIAFTEDKGGILGKEYGYIVSHCGYADAELFELTSFSTCRVKDLECMNSEQVKNWVKENNVELASFNDLPEDWK